MLLQNSSKYRNFTIFLRPPTQVMCVQFRFNGGLHNVFISSIAPWEWGPTTALFVLKIKGDNYMLASWNFIHTQVYWYKYIQNLLLCGGNFHGSQAKKCQNRPYLQNRVPIFEISWKLVWTFSLTIKTQRKNEIDSYT